MEHILEKAKDIRLVIFDVDGVLTDGGLFFGDDGQEYKMFNSRDGHGIRMLKHGGVEMAVLTGRQSEVVKHRMRDLGVSLVIQGQRDKLPAFKILQAETGISAEHMAYVGDDVVDLPVMRRVGFAVAVNDAHPLVIEHAHWVTQKAGGRGAGREVCELILKAQGKLDAMLESYLA
jgi:3-deoxy-D-manno-octulosonate 8-phosphate phosphatase (KDO 8-P phosphatase)